MIRWVLIIALLLTGSASAQLLHGVTDSLSGGGAFAACAGPTGQMDFSVCSNIAITAAVMP